METYQYKLVGHGSYGTVITPPIGKHEMVPINNRYVAKLMLTASDDEVKKEWDSAKVLRCIDPDAQFFLYPLKKMIVQAGDIFNDKKIDMNENVTQFIMPHGGISLRKICTTQPISIKETVDYIIQVAQAIDKLIKHGKIHRDVHAGNVVVREGKCRLIDFGQMTCKNNSFIENIWGDKYAITPPELRSFTICSTTDLHSFMLKEKEILSKYLQVPVEALSFIYDDSFVKKSLSRILQDGQKRQHFELSVFLDSVNAYEKGDIYAIGVMMLELMIHSQPYNNKYVVDYINKTVCSMLFGHPQDRLSIDKLLRHLRILKVIIISNDK